MRKIDVSILILIILGMALGAVLARAQSLNQQQFQGAQDEINSDLSQINQINRDEGDLNTQYQSALAQKDSQMNALSQKIYLLNSWLNPPSNSDNATNNSDQNNSMNMDVEGTVNAI